MSVTEIKYMRRYVLFNNQLSFKFFFKLLKKNKQARANSKLNTKSDPFISKIHLSIVEKKIIKLEVKK